MVTLAPELDGGIDAVAQIAAAGAVPAVGHTDATYDVAHAAVDAGARVATTALRLSVTPSRPPARTTACTPSAARVSGCATGVLSSWTDPHWRGAP
jgi:hypothetical protein